MDTLQITKVVGMREFISESDPAKPTIEYHAEIETETGPLILKAPKDVWNELAANLQRIQETRLGSE